MNPTIVHFLVRYCEVKDIACDKKAIELYVQLPAIPLRQMKK